MPILFWVLAATGTEIVDAPQQISHSVSPADLVERILLVRYIFSDMAPPAVQGNFSSKGAHALLCQTRKV